MKKNKQTKRLKRKVKFLKEDLEYLENRFDNYEKRRVRNKNFSMKIMRFVITLALVALAIAGFYSVFFKS